MKKIIAILLLAVSTLAFAEASFDEIQGLIDKKQYAAAEAGLEVIIKNHPQSAKAFYAMAEAQAGLGNLEKAQKALNLAKGIDPSLKFVSEGSVRKLEQAITPQTNLVTYEEPSHFWRNLFLLIFAGAIGWIIYYFFVYKNKKADDDYKTNTGGSGPSPITPSSSPKKETVAKEYVSSYVPPVRPAYRGPQATVTPAPVAPAPAPTPTTTVVNNTSSGSSDLLTGVLIGNMLSSHHETTRVVEREVVREKPSRDSSWDDTPSYSSSSSSSSRSSSWDDDSSSRKSSSWDDSSSSSRSSSWDNDSSSSSSSSWDSGSSSSSSSDW